VIITHDKASQTQDAMIERVKKLDGLSTEERLLTVISGQLTIVIGLLSRLVDQGEKP